MTTKHKTSRPPASSQRTQDRQFAGSSDETRPASKTHPAVALAGVSAFLAGTVLLYHLRPFETVAHDAILLITLVAIGIFVPDLFWQKVWRNASAGLTRTPAQGSWDRTITKFAGLTASLGFVGMLYWLFPEYTTKSPFYQHFWALLKVLVPLMLGLAIPYLYLVDRRMEQPEDNLWHLGKVVLFQWEGVDGRAVGQQLLGWLIKGFFLPLMFGYMCSDIVRLYQYDYGKVVSFRETWEFLYFFLFYMDVVFGTMGYVMSLRLTDTHIRSSEPTMLGWAVAVVCYEPFWSLIGRQYLQYGSSFSWGKWLWNEPLVYGIWGTTILLLTGVYVWATVIFGGRFSNLTHRGIITSGPYRYTKHPAYIAKNISWWLVAVPFVVTESLAVSLKQCLLLLMVNGIYYLRAKTEERHLSRDPDYVRYARWIDRHGLLRWMNRMPLIGTLARLRLASIGERNPRGAKPADGAGSN